MFIMWRLVAPYINEGALTSYNKTHVNCQVRIEWGIGGLQHKFRRFMKCFDVTKL